MLFHVFLLSLIVTCIKKGLGLIFYLATVLQLVISFRHYLEEFFGLFLPTVSSTNSDTLTSSLLICIPLISIHGLIALAISSSTILNRYGESRYPCLVPDFNGVASISLDSI